MVAVAEIEETMHFAMALNYKVHLTLWMDECPQEITAYIHYINYVNNEIHVKDLEDQVHFIKWDDIIKLETEKPFSY